ncbi:MAG: AAA family ATPase [Vampirovibrionales bacterium]
MMTVMSLTQDTIFCPRVELDRLMEAWELAKHEGPQIRVLYGESGVGKTRLIQEFYKTLAETENPQGYWPAEIHAPQHGPRDIQVNPNFEGYQPNGGQKVPLPYVWWGLRFSSSLTGESALATYVPHLQPHLQALYAFRQLMGLGIKLALSSTPVTFLEALPQVADWFQQHQESITAWCAHAKNALESFLYWKVKNVLSDFHSLNDEVTSSVGCLEAHKQTGAVGTLIQQQQDKRLNGLLKDLESLLTSTKRGIETVPMVLVLDDAQWMRGDREALRFIAQFLEKAYENHWPLLVITTYWQQNLLEDLQNQPLFSNLEQLGHAVDALNYDPRALKPGPQAIHNPQNAMTYLEEATVQFVVLESVDLSPLLSRVLPGVWADEIQREHLRKFCHGYPMLAHELIATLKPHYFEASDKNKPLNQRGLNLMRHAGGPVQALEQVLRERLSQLDETQPDVLVLLKLASLQKTAEGLTVSVRLLEQLWAWWPYKVNAEEPFHTLLQQASLQGFGSSINETFWEFRTLSHRAVCEQQFDDTEQQEAMVVQEQCLKDWYKTFDPTNAYDQPDAVLLLHLLAVVYKKLGEDHRDYAILMMNMGNVYDTQGKYDEALAQHEKAESGLKKLGEDYREYAMLLINMGTVYNAQGK